MSSKLLSTHYRSPIDFSLENITATEKAMDGFYRLFESFEQLTGQSFYSLEVANRRDASVLNKLDDSGLPPDVIATLKELADRYLEAMDDDFNTGGAIGVLFELRRAINAHINTQTGTGATPNAWSAEDKSALAAAMRLLKELAGLLGVFRHPLEKSSGADDALVEGLMQLIIDIRQQARTDKNWAVSDKIRDALKAVNITLEDGREGVRWSRG